MFAESFFFPCFKRCKCEARKQAHALQESLIRLPRKYRCQAPTSFQIGEDLFGSCSLHLTAAQFCPWVLRANPIILDFQGGLAAAPCFHIVGV